MQKSNEISEDELYYEKYIKYKTKYLQLKMEGGGNISYFTSDKPIIILCRGCQVDWTKFFDIDIKNKVHPKMELSKYIDNQTKNNKNIKVYKDDVYNYFKNPNIIAYSGYIGDTYVRRISPLAIHLEENFRILHQKQY